MQKKYTIYPVVEMSPWRAEGGQEIMDKLTIPEMRDSSKYEKATLKVFKINGMQNVQSLDKYAASAIKIGELEDHDLGVLVKMELYDGEIEKEGIDNLSAFEGGLVLEMSDQKAITNQCCGRISDYQNWLKFIDKAPKDWEEIWIGHPWVYGRIRAGIIQLSAYLDETKPPPKDEESAVKFQFELADFKAKLEKIVSEIQQIKIRIKNILEVENNRYAEEIPEILIENKIYEDGYAK